VKNAKQLIATTPRTRIGTIGLDDAAFILELLNSPGWLKYIGDRDVHDLATAKNYIQSAFLDIYEKFGFGYYVIRNEDDQRIGVAGFLKKPYLENADYGFAFLPAYFRQGYGVEVSRAVLAYGQHQFNLNVVDAVTLEENSASRRLLEKLDFDRVGNIKVPDDPAPVLLYRWSA
jgi:RimJ/RimL family protein N-acetyltransferase